MRLKEIFKININDKVGYPFGGWAGEDKPNLLNSFMLSCRALEAEQHRPPMSVSLMQVECSQGEAPSNNLRIFNKQ